MVNDLHSYYKELEALEQGKASDMINLVDVMKTVTGLTGKDDAKSVALSLQLQFEREMAAEMRKVSDGEGGATDEEWKFMEAIMTSAAGHVMFCMTTSRYGREKARLPG